MNIWKDRAVGDRRASEYKEIMGNDPESTAETRH
jgi:hypothetical protein